MNAFESFRKVAGLTQEDAAEALGVNRSAIAKWETGKSLPTAKKLIAVADLYGCTIDALLRPSEPLSVAANEKEGKTA